MAVSRSLGHRALFGAGAFFLADAITGMAAYCLITLSALWYFSWSWIQLAGELSARGRDFGSTLQLDLAWAGLVLILPLMALVVVLTIRAYRWPASLARSAWKRRKTA